MRIFTNGGRAATPVIAVIAGLGLWPHVARAFTLVESSALVFSPTVVEVGQQTNLCVANFGDGSVRVELAITDGTNRTNVLAGQIIVVAAGSEGCVSFSNPAPVTGGPGAPAPIGALIGLLRPAQCGQARTLRGPCKVVGSLEIADIGTGANRLHNEPLLLPAVQIPPLPAQ